MKKLSILLFALLSMAGFSTSAQNTACNAAFSFMHLNGNTVQFNPAMPGTPASTLHYWMFGDGAVSNLVTPVHTYTSGQVFTVKHIIIVNNPNGVEICRDSSFATITVQNSCNLVVNFTVTPITANGNTFHFENTSVPLNPGDSVFWTFGDGNASSIVSPNHTYIQAGIYTVCLKVYQQSVPGTTPCVREICKTVTVQPVNTCTLTASFTWAMVAGTVNTVHFQNTSAPLQSTDSIRWTFGDGTSSNQLHPNHTFAQPGTYNVCLRVQKRDSLGGLTNCVREICNTIVIQFPPACNLQVNFMAYHDSLATVPNTYHFQNLTTPLNNSDSIRWTFGDGSSSNQVNPTHTYAQPGTYLVCLRVQQRNASGGLTNCVRESCDTIVIQSSPACNLLVEFIAHRDSLATVPNTVHFENLSSPINNTDSIRWTFGDGSSSNQVNPIHAYAQPGTYTVCLRIQKRDQNGGLTNCIREICKPVTVTATCNIQSGFTWSTDSLNTRKIYFTNTSMPATTTATAFWSFGDGTTSTAWNPVHEYANPGNYYVCLKLQTSNTCFSYSCDTVIVQAPLPNCNQQSAFSFIRSNTNTLLFHFTPAYANSNWQYTWTFGDGTGSHDINPSHQYAQPGNYTVCLTVYRNAGCASTTCRNVTALTPVNCNNINVSYTYQRDPVVTNKLFFRAVSNYTIASQTWTIKKIATTPGTATITLLQNNPSYVFQDTGWYRVCLRAVTIGGCVKEYCSEIYIQQVFTPSNCNLQMYPNPVSSLLNINIYLTQPQMLDVYIYNSQNVLVKEKHQQGYTGTNMVYIPVASLVAGTYTVKLIHGNSVCYAQFVKL